MIWCWLWWIHYADTLPSRASRDKLSFSSSCAWREEWRRVQCHPSVYNNTPQLTETHTTWYVTTNCFYRLQELFWVVCMVLNVLWNHRLLAFTHVLKWNPFLVLLCKMFSYFFLWMQQQTTGAALLVSGWPSVTYFAEATASFSLSGVLPPLTFADISIKRAKVTQLYKPVLSIISLCYD